MKKRVVWIVSVLAALVALPTAADWLVTHDGARVETKGGWEVKGNQVVFTLPNGTLSVLRKSEVDLEASRLVTLEGQRPATDAPSKPAERRSSVMVLTNKNVRRAKDAAAEGLAEEPTEGEDATTDESATPPATAGGVEMVSWTSRDSGSVDGLEVVGTIKNTGSAIAANIGVKVTVIDQDGEPLLDTSAFLRSTGLAPGKSTTFRALLPGVFSLFRDPRFEISSGSVSVGGPDVSEPEEDEDSSADDVEPADDAFEGEGG